MIGTPGETHSAWRHLIGPAPLGVLAARHRLLAAARAQPIYEPSCRQACDDHAHADEHINENDGNAAVDVHGGPNLEPLLFDDKRRLIPGGYRSSYRAVAIWQLDRLDDRGAALSSPSGRMAELPVLSNCARAVAVEQVNDKQARDGSGSLPLVSSAAARRRVSELEAARRQVHRRAPYRCGSEGADRAKYEHTIAELSALIKPDDKK